MTQLLSVVHYCMSICYQKSTNLIIPTQPIIVSLDGCNTYNKNQVSNATQLFSVICLDENVGGVILWHAIAPVENKEI